MSKHLGEIDSATRALLQEENKQHKSITISRPVPAEKPDLREILNLFDFEDVAQQFLSAKTMAYWVGAANDCITYRKNRSAWEKISLRPHLLKDVAKVDTSCRMLGFEFQMPLFTSPFGIAKLAHPDGELSIVRAAVASGSTMCVSTF